MPENVTDADGNVLNPKVGEQIDIAKDMQPQLFRYEKDTKKLSPVTGDNYKIIIYRGTDEETGEPDNDYDTEGWKWIEVSGQELPILERITENGTSFALTALEKDEDGRWNYIARRDYQVDLYMMMEMTGMMEITETMVITHRCWDRMLLQTQMEIN